ncbi:unnamed protein product [Gadus morhua 'NCC']
MLERASNEVRQGKSVRGVAKTYGICHVTLHRFHKKRQMLESKGSKTLPRVGHRPPTTSSDTRGSILLFSSITQCGNGGILRAT